jgi:hypothetical protein
VRVVVYRKLGAPVAHSAPTAAEAWDGVFMRMAFNNFGI